MTKYKSTKIKWTYLIKKGAMDVLFMDELHILKIIIMHIMIIWNYKLCSSLELLYFELNALVLYSIILLFIVFLLSLILCI